MSVSNTSKSKTICQTRLRMFLRVVGESRLSNAGVVIKNNNCKSKSFHDFKMEKFTITSHDTIFRPVYFESIREKFYRSLTGICGWMCKKHSCERRKCWLHSIFSCPTFSQPCFTKIWFCLEKCLRNSVFHHWIFWKTFWEIVFH